MTRNFLTLEAARREDLRAILDLARAHTRGEAGSPLAGKTVCLAFFEASTRTAVSFELAARRCGADVISLSESGSAIAKGESLVDTVVTLDRLGADALVLRHPAAGAAALDELAGRRVAVIGDVLHSRVARSVIPAFTAAGMEVALVAPATLLPWD